MISFGQSKEIPFDPNFPILDGVYGNSVGGDTNTMLFCTRCDIRFYDGQVRNDEERARYDGALQIALGHAMFRRHPICKALPEWTM